MDDEGPPPPPPPHGEKPRTARQGGPGAGLPDGKYDIFVIPPSSAGSGFLYLPSLNTQRNSFLAGCACTSLAFFFYSVAYPVAKDWFLRTVNGGGSGVLSLILGVGVVAWALGKTQGEGLGMGSKPSFSSKSRPSSKTYDSKTFEESPPRSKPRPRPQSDHEPEPESEYRQYRNASSRPPPRQPSPPPTRESTPPPSQPAPPPPATEPSPAAAPDSEAPKPAPPTEPEAKPQSPPPKPKPSWRNTPTADAKTAWEKAREETRKREEDRKRAAEIQRRREELEKERQRQREKATLERLEREWKEKKEKEDEAARQADIETKAKQAKDEADKKVQREKERREREAREALLKAAKEAREAKEALERTRKEDEDRRAREAKEDLEKKKADDARVADEARKAAEEARRAEIMRKLEESRKEEARKAEALRSARASNVSSNKRPPMPSAKTEKDDDAYSFRPYDRPRSTQKSSSGSVYSDDSYAPSATTAKTTPPGSTRGPYTTKDPDKVIIKGVYSFNNAFMRTPISQLITGTGNVTDGLILRITTEGLFIDDDVRGVPQREWDIKAWTLKLAEVSDHFTYSQFDSKHSNLSRRSNCKAT